MKPAAVAFYITGAMVFIQLVTGGLRVFFFLDESSHITTGVITFVVALVALILAGLSKPRFWPAVGNAGAIVVAIVIQGLLGFAFLDTNNFSIIMVHYVWGLVIFAMGIGLIFNAMRWGRTAPAVPPAQR